MFVAQIARRSLLPLCCRSFSSQVMPPTYSSKDSNLISELRALQQRSPKLVRSSVYPAPADPTISIQSWKMDEFKYYAVPSPFPTLARGVFTMDVSEDECGVKHRIVARGYDKFFNVGEVPWTTWEAIEKNTTAPYTLSLKSNGCVIFIAALTPQKLLITSKHSLGPVQGTEISHAEAGEVWLRRYLEEKGKTEEELATRLWENNWTAVAELCDDSFEEHVLGYPPERTGLHLHGLNLTTKEFKTMPQETVDSFAEEWGFVKTRSHIVNSIQELREFTSHISKIGHWDGEAVEGFVVRTTQVAPTTSDSKGKSPYSPGSSFFFKIKFDEPYMMYRDWRELTKKLLSTNGPLRASDLQKSKMKRRETKVYVKWVIDEIQRDRSQFDGFMKGRGIIAARERFLEWYEEQEASGKDPLKGVKDDRFVERAPNSKVIIAPIAVPGCGKTSVSIALGHLFNLGHTQSDDIKARKPVPVFQQNVRSLLQRRRVVIADKNNHLRLHRRQLAEVARKFKPHARIIALNFSLSDKSPAMIHQLVSDRIVNRGANHQTLIPKDGTSSGHEDVVWMFLNQHEALSDGEVDGCVELDVEQDLEGMVRSAVDGLWEVIGGEGGVLGDEKPSEEKIMEAVEVAKAYKIKETGNKAAKEDKPPRYYGLVPNINLREILDSVFADAAGDSNRSSGALFWEQLKKSGRVTKQPHVTIVHLKSLPQEANLWNVSKPVVVSTPSPLFAMKFNKVLWNDRVMVLTVDHLGLQEDGKSTPESEGFLGEVVRERLHVTVGTAINGIRPVEGKELVERWRRGGEDAEGIFEADVGEGGVVASGLLKGLFA